ncbi:hypothetical protein GCM10019059_27800 [Camelimonas fluminis]|nr:hypothetical protein GCM10019059_27800 [Camelimonas fluminis]
MRLIRPVVGLDGRLSITSPILPCPTAPLASFAIGCARACFHAAGSCAMRWLYARLAGANGAWDLGNDGFSATGCQPARIRVAAPLPAPESLIITQRKAGCIAGDPRVAPPTSPHLARLLQGVSWKHRPRRPSASGGDQN